MASPLCGGGGGGGEWGGEGCPEVVCLTRGQAGAGGGVGGERGWSWARAQHRRALGWGGPGPRGHCSGSGHPECWPCAWPEVLWPVLQGLTRSSCEVPALIGAAGVNSSTGFPWPAAAFPQLWVAPPPTRGCCGEGVAQMTAKPSPSHHQALTGRAEQLSQETRLWGRQPPTPLQHLSGPLRVYFVFFSTQLWDVGALMSLTRAE